MRRNYPGTYTPSAFVKDVHGLAINSSARPLSPRCFRELEKIANVHSRPSRFIHSIFLGKVAVIASNIRGYDVHRSCRSPRLSPSSCANVKENGDHSRPYLRKLRHIPLFFLSTSLLIVLRAISLG